MTAAGERRKNEARFREALSRLPEEKKPALVELSGMPRLGKTVFCDSLIDLARQAGLKAKLASKATAASPISDRWSCEYTAWSLVSLVKDYLEARELGVDVLVADRGLFDACAWLRVKEARGGCTAGEAAALRGIVEGGVWRENLAAVIVFLGPHDLVLDRAAERRLYSGRSTVTTTQTLAALEQALLEESSAWNGNANIIHSVRVVKSPIPQALARALDVLLDALDSYGRNA